MLEFAVIFVVFILVGLAMAIVPWVADLPIAPLAKLCISALGMAMTMVAFLAMMMNKLYRRPKANVAFVRTGMGGLVIIKDGGALVVPVLHELLPVSLETVTVTVERRGDEALRARDGRFIELSAEFQVRVEPEYEQILLASRALGSRAMDPRLVSELVYEQLAAALRKSAVIRDAGELAGDGFASQVKELASKDLAANGLSLVALTLSEFVELQDAEPPDRVANSTN